MSDQREEADRLDALRITPDGRRIPDAETVDEMALSDAIERIEADIARLKVLCEKLEHTLRATDEVVEEVRAWKSTTKEGR